MRTSESLTKLAEALSKAQGELGNVTKDNVNPHFKSKYADLASVRDAVKPVLAKHGLSVIQLPVYTEQGIALTTRLLHTSGEWVEGELLLMLSKPDMQGVVSAITYARRVSLAAVTGVAPVDDDDDGNAATGKPAEGQQQPAPQRQSAAPAARSAQPPARPSAAPRAVPSAKPATAKQAFVDALEKATTDPFADVPHPADISAADVPF
jgi:hypothetical protein